MDVKNKTEKLKDAMETEAEPGEKLDDVQWLNIKYGTILEREKALVEYLIKVLRQFDNRIKVLEKKLE